MSDVLWIQWAAVANAQGIPGKASDLKYIFRHEIITPNTQFIMEKAGNDPDAEEGEVFFKPWPGREFTMGEEQFQALMGTVHAKSIVTLLTTHPRELGTKSIEKVNIFATRDPEDSTSIYHMLWTLTG